jgi:hypothetical protein
MNSTATESDGNLNPCLMSPLRWRNRRYESHSKGFSYSETVAIAAPAGVTYKIGWISEPGIGRVPPRRQAVLLLRAGISGLSTLRLKRCCCVELLLDARLNSQRLFGLLGLRGSACPGRDRSLTETAGGERQTDYER